MPPTHSTRALVLEQLAPLVGMPLSSARRAADMRVLHFGAVRAVRNGTVGELALHIQCPWRLEGPDGIVTGRSDLWEPIDPSARPANDAWDYESAGNLQDHRLAAVVGPTGVLVADASRLVVESIDADDYGGVSISFTRGYRLAVFPSGSAGEDWRLLHVDGGEHFVIVGGAPEATPDS